MTYVPVKTRKGHEKHGFEKWTDSGMGNYQFRCCVREFCECMKECCYQQRGLNFRKSEIKRETK